MTMEFVFLVTEEEEVPKLRASPPEEEVKPFIIVPLLPFPPPSMTPRRVFLPIFLLELP